LRDRDRQYLLILHWLGFRRAELDVKQASRAVGRSSYTLRQLVRVAADGLFFQSTVLLRWIIYFGFFLGFLGALLAGYALISWVTGHHLPNWTALPMFGLFLAAFIIVSGGVTGLYVGKIFEQVKGRPLFVVDEIAGRDEGDAAAAATASVLAAASAGEPVLRADHLGEPS
jgi:polyisoprenyl-phosphate glycosyltransferase